MQVAGEAKEWIFSLPPTNRALKQAQPNGTHFKYFFFHFQLPNQFITHWAFSSAKMCLLFSLSILVLLPPFYLQPLSAHAWFNSAPSTQMSLSPGSANSNTSSHVCVTSSPISRFYDVSGPLLPLPHQSHTFLFLTAPLHCSHAYWLLKPCIWFYFITFIYHAPDLKYSLPSSLLTHAPHCPSRFSLKLLRPLYISSHSQLHLSLCLALDICGINHDPWHPS